MYMQPRWFNRPLNGLCDDSIKKIKAFVGQKHLPIIKIGKKIFRRMHDEEILWLDDGEENL